MFFPVCIMELTNLEKNWKKIMEGDNDASFFFYLIHTKDFLKESNNFRATAGIVLYVLCYTCMMFACAMFHLCDCHLCNFFFFCAFVMLTLQCFNYVVFKWCSRSHNTFNCAMPTNEASPERLSHMQCFYRFIVSPVQTCRTWRCGCRPRTCLPTRRPTRACSSACTTTPAATWWPHSPSSTTPALCTTCFSSAAEMMVMSFASYFDKFSFHQLSSPSPLPSSYLLERGMMIEQGLVVTKFNWLLSSVTKFHY